MPVNLCSAPINTAENVQPAKNKELNSLWEYQLFLAKLSYSYFTIFYDDRHCPSAVRASERPAVVSFRWLQRDAFTTAQADYS
jgi:hypothetical protein